MEIVSKETATRLIAKPTNATLVAIRQDFTGAFSGRALLIFPESFIGLGRSVARSGTAAPDDSLGTPDVESISFLWHHSSAVPPGLGALLGCSPALKCRAIFKRPSGTIQKVRLSLETASTPEVMGQLSAYG